MPSKITSDKAILEARKTHPALQRILVFLPHVSYRPFSKLLDSVGKCRTFLSSHYLQLIIPFSRMVLNPVCDISKPKISPTGLSGHYSESSTPASPLLSPPIQSFNPCPTPLPPHIAFVSNSKATSWPHQLYTIDVAGGLQLFDSSLFIKVFPNPNERFVAILNQPYRKSTVYDAQKRWSIGPAKDRHQALTAGRKPDGKWSVYASKYPLRD